MDPEQERAARIAERVGGRRSRVLLVQLILFLGWQASYISAQVEDGPARAVDHVRISAWVVWTAVLLLMLLTGGGWIWSREVRRRLNDELSVHNRHEGQRAGFWGAMAAGFGLYLASFYATFEARDVVHIIFTAGIAAAFLRYLWLERRGERGD